MAIAPLFVDNRTTLETRLRVQKAKQPGAEGQIDNAIKKVWTNFYSALGPTRVTEILAFSTTDSPATANEIIRARAEAVEVDWVRKELLVTMPVLFADGAGGEDQSYNEDGLTRDANLKDLEKICERLEKEIQAGLEEIAGATGLTLPVGVQASSIGPDCPPPVPFSSLKPPLINVGTI